MMMDSLSTGFLEALANDFDHAASGLKPAPRRVGEGDHSLQPLEDFFEVMKEHDDRQPLMPNSNFRMPRSKKNEAYRRGSLMDESVESSIAGAGGRRGGTLKTHRPKHHHREYDLSSFAEAWTLSKGWKNRPRKKVGSLSEDIMAYQKRVQGARAMGKNVKGFEFGYHRSVGQGSLCDGDGDGEKGGLSSSSLRATSASLIRDPSYVSTLKGDEKIKAITKAFFVGKSLTLGEKYDPTNVQDILRRNVRESHPRIHTQICTVTTRRGPHGPILIPRAGSPLANAKSLTFGYCRRFPYDRLLSPERKFQPARSDR